MNPEQLEIINRVKDMFFHFGIKSVTMDDIARELGISKKTLYQHFADKSELVEGVVNTQIEISTAVADRLIGECPDAISEMFSIHQFMDKMAREHSYVVENDLRKYYPALFLKIINTKRERIYRIGKDNIERGKLSGLYRPEVNAEIIAKTNLMRFESSMGSCIFTNEELMSKDFYTEILIYHIRGIASPKGIERLEELLQKNGK